jgi:hypothetical protein
MLHNPLGLWTTPRKWTAISNNNTSKVYIQKEDKWYEHEVFLVNRRRVYIESTGREAQPPDDGSPITDITQGPNRLICSRP